MAASLRQLIQKVVGDYLATKAEEDFLIVADTGTSQELISVLIGEATSAGAVTTTALMTPRRYSGEEPPKTIGAAMKEADVIIAPVTASIYHTSAKYEAQKAGARGLLNAPPKSELWTRGAMTADLHTIRPRAEKLASLLRSARRLHVTSDSGTNITLDKTGRNPVGWLTAICQKPGEISALPGGEVSFAPIEGTAHGQIVFELAVGDIGGVETPIKIDVDKGLAVKISGGKEADCLREIVLKVENGRNIAELGIGLNPEALLIPDIDEAKKRLGTAHMALGDNTWGYGGVVSSDIHLDGLILNATIEVDGKKLVERGKVLI